MCQGISIFQSSIPVCYLIACWAYFAICCKNGDCSKFTGMIVFLSSYNEAHLSFRYVRKHMSLVAYQSRFVGLYDLWFERDICSFASSDDGDLHVPLHWKSPEVRNHQGKSRTSQDGARKASLASLSATGSVWCGNAIARAFLKQYPCSSGDQRDDTVDRWLFWGYVTVASLWWFFAGFSSPLKSMYAWQTNDDAQITWQSSFEILCFLELFASLFCRKGGHANISTFVLSFSYELLWPPWG